jgi:hypothetical protein
MQNFLGGRGYPTPDDPPNRIGESDHSIALIATSMANKMNVRKLFLERWDGPA